MSPSDAVLPEVIDLLDKGILIDRSDRPLVPYVTVIASKNLKTRDKDVRKFVRELKRLHPFARLVLGDVAPVEKVAREEAEKVGIPVEVVKADEGATYRDMDVVRKAKYVVAFDQSARAKHYEKLAKPWWWRKVFYRV